MHIQHLSITAHASVLHPLAMGDKESHILPQQLRFHKFFLIMKIADQLLCHCFRDPDILSHMIILPANINLVQLLFKLSLFQKSYCNCNIMILPKLKKKKGRQFWFCQRIILTLQHCILLLRFALSLMPVIVETRPGLYFQQMYKENQCRAISFIYKLSMQSYL